MRLARRLICQSAPASGGGGAPPISGTIYYVDPVAGNDSNNGTSTATPWKTATKVNAGASYAGGGLQPGQGILFKGGNTLTGTLVFKAGVNIASFSATNPITIGSYGSGDAIINSSATGNWSYAVLIDGFSGCVFTGLTVSANGAQCQFGIYIQNTVTSAGTSNITVIDNTVSGFHTNNSISSNPASEIYMAGGGHTLGTGPGGYKITNINILNNLCFGLSGVTSHDDNGILAQGDITGSGYHAVSSDLTNITVGGNTVYNIGGNSSSLQAYAGGSGNGILLAQCGSSVIKYNLVHDCGANITSCGGCAGIWTYSSYSITIEYNESYYIRPWPTFSGGCDWENFNCDGGSQDCIVQFNYSHDSYGPGFLGYVDTEGTGSWNNNVYRFNYSVNDAYGDSGTTFSCMSWGGGTQPSPCLVYVYFNTIINTTPGMSFGSGGTLSNTNNAPQPGCLTNVSNNAVPTGGYIVNNIFVSSKNNAGDTQFTSWKTVSGGSPQWINNAYYSINGGTPVWRLNFGSFLESLSAWQAAINGGEVGAITTNPNFNSGGTSGVGVWTPSAQIGPGPTWGPTAFMLTSES